MNVMKLRLIRSNISFSNSSSSSKVFPYVVIRFLPDVIRSQKLSALSAPMLHCDDIAIKGMNPNKGCFPPFDVSKSATWKGPTSNGSMLSIKSKGAVMF